MIARFLFWLTAHRPARLIKLDGQPYLERYYAGSLFGFYFYLHRFVRSDGERHVHDHPWNSAMSLVLTGHYVEVQGRVADRIHLRSRIISWFNRITRKPGKHTVHRIAATEAETWTLFFHSEWQHGWGFYDVNVDGTYTYTPYKIDRARRYWWLDHNTVTGNQVGREPFGG